MVRLMMGRVLVIEVQCKRCSHKDTHCYTAWMMFVAALAATAPCAGCASSRSVEKGIAVSPHSITVC